MFGECGYPGASADNAGGMDVFDWRRDSAEAMMAFARRWAPYGGGEAAEIWLHFGVSERVFFLRLAHLLDTPPT